MTDQTAKPWLNWEVKLIHGGFNAATDFGVYEIFTGEINGRKYVSSTSFNPKLGVCVFLSTCSDDISLAKAKQLCQAHADKLHNAEQALASAAIPAALPPEMPQEPAQLDIEVEHKLFEASQREKYAGMYEVFFNRVPTGEYYDDVVQCRFENWLASARVQRSAQPVAQPQEPVIHASPIPWAKHWHHRDGVLIAESTPIARAVFNMVGLYCTRDGLLDWLCSVINYASAQPCPAPAPKSAAFPPRDPRRIDCSVDVLAIDASGRFDFGCYLFDCKEWDNGIGPFNPVEWHALPELKTGTPVPQTKKEIKP